MPIHLSKVSDQNKVFYERLFERSRQIDSGEYKPPSRFQEESLGMIFFEPSSRTKWSFYKAAQNMGLKVMSTFVDSSTSLSKGEALQDTLELFLNLDFDIVVMRSKENEALARIIAEHVESVNFINAGFGSIAHPTQALLDVYTWSSSCKFKAPPNVLIMGDLKHSRVARSHLRLAQILGYKVGLCPLESLALDSSELEELRPSSVFESRKEALAWADIVMPLRAQKERFESSNHESYRAKPLESSELSKNHWLMHPGPIVWGEDMNFELMQYSKSLISLQQRSGVVCRAALISLMMEEK